MFIYAEKPRNYGLSPEFQLFYPFAQKCPAKRSSSPSGPNSKRPCVNPKYANFQKIVVPLPNDVKAEDVTVKINDKGLVQISSSVSNLVERERGAGLKSTRKWTEVVEETIQLPSYLMDKFDRKVIGRNFGGKSQDTDGENSDVMIDKDTNLEQTEASTESSTSKASVEEKVKLLGLVESKFRNGRLIIFVPNEPKVEEEKPEVEENQAKKVKRNGPVDIKINFVE